jgi:hypothetical protein
MTFLAFVTWLAIGVLIFGSSAVFIWFLFDVRKVIQGDAPPPVEGTSDGEAP